MKIMYYVFLKRFICLFFILDFWNSFMNLGLRIFLVEMGLVRIGFRFLVFFFEM